MSDTMKDLDDSARRMEAAILNDSDRNAGIERLAAMMLEHPVKKKPLAGAVRAAHRIQDRIFQWYQMGPPAPMNAWEEISGIIEDMSGLRELVNAAIEYRHHTLKNNHPFQAGCPECEEFEVALKRVKEGP